MNAAQEQKTDTQVPSHSAAELTNTEGLARIEHDGQVYTLRITRMNKLILTK